MLPSRSLFERIASSGSQSAADTNLNSQLLISIAASVAAFELPNPLFADSIIGISELFGRLSASSAPARCLCLHILFSIEPSRSASRSTATPVYLIVNSAAESASSGPRPCSGARGSGTPAGILVVLLETTKLSESQEKTASIGAA